MESSQLDLILTIPPPMIEKGSALKRGCERVCVVLYFPIKSVDSVRRVSRVHLLLDVQEFKCALIFCMFFFYILSK